MTYLSINRLQRTLRGAVRLRTVASGARNMLSRFAVVAFLIVQTSAVFADDCRCKTPAASTYVTTPCPSKSSSAVPAPAILPAMSYRAIEIHDFLALIGKMAGIKVCVSTDTSGLIKVSSSKLLAWPAFMKDVAKQNSLEITSAHELVYVRSQGR